MDLHRRVGVRGLIAPNAFAVTLSPADVSRLALGRTPPASLEGPGLAPKLPRHRILSEGHSERPGARAGRTLDERSGTMRALLHGNNGRRTVT